MTVMCLSFLLRMKSHKSFRETLDTYFIYDNFFRKYYHIWENVDKKILYRVAGHRWKYGEYALHAGYLRLQMHTLKLDFRLTVHHQLGKVIQMNQLDATMIYWSIRSAQHVSGNILPIIRSVRLRYLQHMVSCKDGYRESYVVSYVICRIN